MEHSLFVGDLSLELSDFQLQEAFRNHYPSVRTAKVVTDMQTGRSKGYGFVRFLDEDERDRAVTEMNGQPCMGRPMRVSLATPRGRPGQPPGAGPPPPPMAAPPGAPPSASSGDPEAQNTTVFVGGLDAAVTEDDLRNAFAQFGELVYVKIPPGKGCGFVQYVHRSNAEEAMSMLHGAHVGPTPIRLSWGRSPGQKRFPGGPPAAGASASATPSYTPPGYDPAAAAAWAQWGAYAGYPGYEAYAAAYAADPYGAAAYAQQPGWDAAAYAYANQAYWGATDPAAAAAAEEGAATSSQAGPKAAGDAAAGAAGETGTAPAASATQAGQPGGQMGAGKAGVAAGGKRLATREQFNPNAPVNIDSMNDKYMASIDGRYWGRLWTYPVLPAT